jgi:hypothetical protein
MSYASPLFFVKSNTTFELPFQYDDNGAGLDLRQSQYNIRCEGKYSVSDPSPLFTLTSNPSSGVVMTGALTYVVRFPKATLASILGSSKARTVAVQVVLDVASETSDLGTFYLRVERGVAS